MTRNLLALGFIPFALVAQRPVFIAIPTGPAQERPLRVSRTETTVEQFAAFVKATNYLTEAEKAGAQRTWKATGFPISRKQPVVYVTPTDAAAYCGYVDARLPTDQEWEYAARAGSTTRHYWGDSIDGRYLWYRPNSDGRPHPVGKKRPNAWRLFDMEGNVWEWAISTPENGKPTASRRGGSWIDCEDIDGGPGKPSGALIALSWSAKAAISIAHRYDNIGFRCVRAEP